MSSERSDPLSARSDEQLNRFPMEAADATLATLYAIPIMGIVFTRVTGTHVLTIVMADLTLTVNTLHI